MQNCLAGSAGVYQKKCYQGLNTVPLTFLPDNNLSNEVEGLDLEALESFVYQNVPLGELTLPSLRWIMRRHHLAGVRKCSSFASQIHLFCVEYLSPGSKLDFCK
jgi:hypothetical protein